MAYDYTKLYMISNNLGSSGRKTFAYDTAEDITAESYFPKESGIKDGDVLQKRTATVVAEETTAMVFTDYVMQADASTGELTAIAATNSVVDALDARVTALEGA